MPSCSWKINCRQDSFIQHSKLRCCGLIDRGSLVVTLLLDPGKRAFNFMTRTVTPLLNRFAPPFIASSFMNIFTDVFSNKGKRYFHPRLPGPPIWTVIQGNAINCSELCQTVNAANTRAILGILIYRPMKFAISFAFNGKLGKSCLLYCILNCEIFAIPFHTSWMKLSNYC